MTEERCIDGSPHKFVFLESKTQEIGWHKWAKVDTFYCEKCLKYETTEKEIVPNQRW